MLTRRSFIQRSGMALAVSGVLPSFLTRAAQAAQEGGVTTRYGSDTQLVVIQITGGNDGLNTVVPLANDTYYSLRPQLAIRDALPLTDSVGLHPSMTALQGLYQAGQVAIVQGAGYPNQNLSHFRATEIWQTASPDGYNQPGWLASYVSSANAAANPVYAASVTDGLNRSLSASGVPVPAIQSIDNYQFRTDQRYAADRTAQLAFMSSVTGLDYRRLPLQEHIVRTTSNALASAQNVQEAVRAYSSQVQYPQFELANRLRTVAQLMAGNMGTRVYYTAFGGFDTHANQLPTHTRLLGGFSDSVSTFLGDLQGMGLADRTLIMVFSEFGRRPQENGSIGSDHGTAAPMFVIGTRVRGGIYGDQPSLTDLDSNRNLKYGVDFRAVYGSVLENWLGASQEASLGSRWENVGFI
jgi:uncharacterized protein (DUF1501 family)